MTLADRIARDNAKLARKIAKINKSFKVAAEKATKPNS